MAGVAGDASLDGGASHAGSNDAGLARGGRTVPRHGSIAGHGRRKHGGGRGSVVSLTRTFSSGSCLPKDQLLKREVRYGFPKALVLLLQLLQRALAVISISFMSSSSNWFDLEEAHVNAGKFQRRRSRSCGFQNGDRCGCPFIACRWTLVLVAAEDNLCSRWTPECLARTTSHLVGTVSEMPCLRLMPAPRRLLQTSNGPVKRSDPS